MEKAVVRNNWLKKQFIELKAIINFNQKSSEKEKTSEVE